MDISRRAPPSTPADSPAMRQCASSLKPLPIYDAIFTRDLRTRLGVLVKFHVDPGRILAPDLPAIVGAHLLASRLDAVFRQLLFDRIDILDLQAEVLDPGPLAYFLVLARFEYFYKIGLVDLQIEAKLNAVFYEVELLGETQHITIKPLCLLQIYGFYADVS